MAGWLTYEKVQNQNPNSSSSTKLLIKTQDNRKTWAVSNVLAKKILTDINSLDVEGKEHIASGVNGCYPNYSSSRNFYLYFTNPKRAYTACGFISNGQGEDFSETQFWNDLRTATNNY